MKQMISHSQKGPLRVSVLFYTQIANLPFYYGATRLPFSFHNNPFLFGAFFHEKEISRARLIAILVAPPVKLQYKDYLQNVNKQLTTLNGNPFPSITLVFKPMQLDQPMLSGVRQNAYRVD